MEFKQLEKLSGDASFRKFYRHKKNKSIIVYCKKEKFKNLIIYEAVNRFLKNNNINTPKLISENYKKNFIEIEDLGNLTGLKKYKILLISNRFDEHVADYSKDFIKIKELALKEKQLNTIQTWMSEKIIETYIFHELILI